MRDIHPGDPLARHFRLTPLQTKALGKLRIATVRDLLYHFPDRYERAGTETRSDTLVPGAKVTLTKPATR
jgi:RecG-like helicase